MKSNKHDRPEQLPTVSGPNLGPAKTSIPPEVEGYEILRVLGEGGMGIVYLAQQKHPVQRQVALKVVKPGMDSKRVVTRFEAEQQALALLDHPNIAQVYDAGTTKSGHPYFSMEYVSGQRITEHCDRYGLGIEERLDLFVQVCEGVQHAHQKGIIHRDIKPSNILVFTHGTKALPKIIDFGVAKALSASLTTETLFTEQGQLLGTPEYMSPEQAQMNVTDIDTRSDIYSLGVVLYELLVGTIPFDPKTLREGGIEKIRHMICEEGPRTPSMRLSTLSGEESASVARLRCTDVRTLAKQLHDDLDWITLKAMDKDRLRRYGSAGELAADIRRHMNHEPVMAGPPSISYQFKKFVRRHRHFAAASAFVAISLLLGFVISTILYFRAERVRAEAQASSRRAQQASQLAQQAAEEAEQAADREAAARAEAQTLAQYLIDNFLGSVTPARAKSPEVSVKTLLDLTSEDLGDKFRHHPLIEARIRQAFGETYRKLGEYESAEPHLRRAFDIRRDLLGDDDPSTVASMGQLGQLYFLQARYDKAEPLLTNAYNARFHTLRPEDPDMLESEVRLAMLYFYHTPSTNRDKMLTLLDHASDIGTGVLGEGDTIALEAEYGRVMWYALNKSTEGAISCERGFLIASQAFGQKHPLTLQFKSCLAIYRSLMAQYNEAEKLALEACQVSREILGADHPITLQCMWALSFAYSCQLQLDKAEKLLKDIVLGSQRRFGKEHYWTLWYAQQIAMVHLKQGRLKEAEKQLTEVLESERRLLGEEHDLVLTTSRAIISLYAMQGKSDTLKAWCSDEIEKLGGKSGGDPDAVATRFCMLAWIQATYPSRDILNGSEAIKNAKHACELTNGQDWRCFEVLAAAYAEADDFASAISFQTKARDWAIRVHVSVTEAAHLNRRLELYKSNKHYRESLLSLEGSYLYLSNYDEESEKALTNAMDHCRRVFGQGHPETQGCIMALVELYQSWDDVEKAEEYRKQLLKTDMISQRHSTDAF